MTQGEPPVARLPQIRSEYKARYREFATLTSLYVAFDLDRPPFTDQDVRRAVGFALDLRALGQIQDGFLSPACNAIPAQVPGYVEIDPCPYGTRDGDPDLVRAEELVRGSRERRAPVVVDGGATPRAAALARYGVQTLEKIGLRARLARTARDRLRAQMRFNGITPPMPRPAPYLDVVTDSGVRSDVGALQRDTETPKGAALGGPGPRRRGGGADRPLRPPDHRRAALRAPGSRIAACGSTRCTGSTSRASACPDLQAITRTRQKE